MIDMEKKAIENEIYYTVKRIEKSPHGRTFCITSSLGTEFEMLVSEEQYERFDVEQGEIIDDNHFLKIREEMLFDNARRQAFNILSFGENNKKSLVDKLHKKGFSYELSEKIAIYMENRGYIDEKKQISLLCDTYLKKKFGKIKIVNELVIKGYKRDEVLSYIQNELGNINYAENCAYIISHKYIPFPTDPESIKKMMGALMKYGYSIAEIKEAVRICAKKE